MPKAVIASRNDGKISEIRRLLTIPGLELLTYRDLEGWPEVREDAPTFKENALIKAEALSKTFGISAIADDSGLEVDALGGAPGIRSARFAGEPSNDRANVEKLLRELSGTEQSRRIARFRCAAVYAEPGGMVVEVEGTLEGHIAFEPRGSGGFGYDPVFVPEGMDSTLAELEPDAKNRISHRGRAFLLLKQEIEPVFEARTS